MIIALVIYSAALTNYYIRSKADLKQIKSKNSELLTSYISLINSKTKTDTLYRYLPAKTIHRTQFKAVYDTIYVDAAQSYGVYKDSIKTNEISLYAQIVASDLMSVDYTYSVREKVIQNNSIITKMDTLLIPVHSRSLYALLDIGKHSYSAGLQYNTRKRLGLTARINLFQDEKYISLGAVYRIF